MWEPTKIFLLRFIDDTLRLLLQILLRFMAFQKFLLVQVQSRELELEAELHGNFEMFPESLCLWEIQMSAII
jgi:hypothetical protein